MSVEHARVRALCEDDPDDRGAYVLYWMQQSQRSAHNPALEAYGRRVAEITLQFARGHLV